jgi:hypothetical protein
MSKWKLGYTQETIFSKINTLDERQYYGSSGYTKAQRLEHLSKRMVLPRSEGTGGSFIVGREEKTLCDIIKIEKTYNILPSKEFDPHDYISKSKLKIERYNATIKSACYVLEGANLL